MFWDVNGVTHDSAFEIPHDDWIVVGTAGHTSIGSCHGG